MPVSECPDHVDDAIEMQHAHHAMPEDTQEPMQDDCCDDMSTLACQLHCASASSCMTEVVPYTNNVELEGFSPDSRMGQRLPPHEDSLLRPPQPLS